MAMVFAFIGTTEVLIVLAIALLVFGPAKLPEIGRQIAQAMREMRKMSNEVQRAFDLDSYDHNNRHNPSGYSASGATTWQPDEYGQNASNATGDLFEADAAEQRAALPGTRPWSVGEDDPSNEEDPPLISPGGEATNGATAGGGARVFSLPAMATEPPGPAKKQEES